MPFNGNAVGDGRHRGYVLAILRRHSMPIWPNTPMYSIADAASRACNTKQNASLGPKNAVNRRCPPLKCHGMAISSKIPTISRYVASSNAENEQNSPPIRDILRKAYMALIQAHQVSIAAHPNWRETPESFAKYKAQCLADYALVVDLTFDGANELICDEEKAKLRRLDQREKIRAFQLGNDAKARFLAQI